LVTFLKANERARGYIQAWRILKVKAMTVDCGDDWSQLVAKGEAVIAESS